jgi:hypothetical protein
LIIRHPPLIHSKLILAADAGQGVFMPDEQFSLLLERLNQIEATLANLVGQRTVKDWYSTDEVAQLLGKAPFTVRQWCRLRRVRAKKSPCGRGLSAEWMIPHEELERIQNEGLLPLQDA